MIQVWSNIQETRILMNEQLQTIMRAMRMLSVQDKLELLHVLSSDLHEPALLEDSSAAFWKPQSIDTLSFLYLTPAVSDIRSLAVGFWPSDESADDINAFIASRRHAEKN
jgi:hypothetical protein